MKLVILAVTALVLMGCVLVFVGVSSSATPIVPVGFPPTTIAGMPNSSGTLVTWTITISNEAQPFVNSQIVLLFPSHPIGSTTSLDPAGTGPPIEIFGDGTAVVSQSPAPGTTFCGENVAIDLLQGANGILKDLPGSLDVTCVPPTTTTTVPPTTTTTLPSTTTTTVPIPCVTSGFAGCSGGGENCGAGPTGHCDPTPTTLPDISQEQQVVQVAPGVTGGNG